MSSWNGMKIDLSGSKAKITPAPSQTTSEEDREINELDGWQGCDYFQAIDLGATHKQAIVLAKDSELFGAFLDRKIK